MNIRKLVTNGGILVEVVLVLVLLACLSASAGPLADQASCRVYNTQGGSQFAGSGTLIMKNREADTGIIISCAHLFSDGAGNIRVTFRGGESLPGKLVRIDTRADLSAILISCPEVDPVRVDINVKKGAAVFSNGYGSGLFKTTTGKYTHNSGRPGQHNIETNFPSRQGDSGGGLFNLSDNLVGIVWGTNASNSSVTHGAPLRAFIQDVIGGKRPLRLFVNPGQLDCPDGTCPNPNLRAAQPRQPRQRAAQPNCPTGNCPDFSDTPTPAAPIEDSRLDSILARLDAVEERLSETDGHFATIVSLLTGERLAVLVAEHLPPITALTLDKDGNVLDRLDVRLGGQLPLRFSPKTQ